MCFALDTICDSYAAKAIEIVNHNRVAITRTNVEGHYRVERLEPNVYYAFTRFEFREIVPLNTGQLSRWRLRMGGAHPSRRIAPQA